MVSGIGCRVSGLSRPGDTPRTPDTRHPRAKRASYQLRHYDGDIVFLRGAAAERLDVVEDGIAEGRGVSLVRGHEARQPLQTVHLAVGVARLVDAVAVEHEEVAGGEVTGALGDREGEAHAEGRDEEVDERG